MIRKEVSNIQFINEHGGMYDKLAMDKKVKKGDYYNERKIVCKCLMRDYFEEGLGQYTSHYKGAKGQAFHVAGWVVLLFFSLVLGIATLNIGRYLGAKERLKEFMASRRGKIAEQIVKCTDNKGKLLGLFNKAKNAVSEKNYKDKIEEVIKEVK